VWRETSFKTRYKRRGKRANADAKRDRGRALSFDLSTSTFSSPLLFTPPPSLSPSLQLQQPNQTKTNLTGPNVKSPKNNKPTSSAKAEVGSEWIDEDPKMQLAGDAGPAEFSRAKVFLEATTASGSPSAPNEAPKETGHVPAPGKYTHVTSGGAK